MVRFPSDYDACRRIIAPDGSYDHDAVEALDLDAGLLVSMYESMVGARVLEQRGLTFQRRGDLHFWMECRGLEASHVGSAAALTEIDWLQTEWRQYGAQIQRGRSLEDIFMFWLRGDEAWESDESIGIPADERRTPYIVAVGTEIPQLVGHMWGRKYRGFDDVGLVSFGDGAASKGDFHAGLNFAGVFDIPVVFLLLNNQWAISVPGDQQHAGDTFTARAAGYGFDGVLVDGNDVLAVYDVTRSAIEHARDTSEPTLIEALTYRRGAHSSSDDPSRYRDADEVAAWRERDPIDRFEEFLIAEGILDSADRDDIWERADRQTREAFENAKRQAEKRSPAEAFELTYANPPAALFEDHAAYPGSAESASSSRSANSTSRTLHGGGIGRGDTETEELTLVEGVRAALESEMSADESVVVLGEDVGRSGGVFRATEGLYAEFGSERVIDTPLTETGIAGAATGLATAGLKPVAEIQFMGFIYSAIEQLFTRAARLHARSRGRYPCQLVIRVPFGGGIRAPDLHGESMEALFVHYPGLKVVAPSTPRDAKGLLLSAIRDPDPVIFMEPKKIYRSFREPVPTPSYEVPLGEAAIRTEGRDVTLLTWGAVTRPSIKAAKNLRDEVSVEVIDLRSLYPLDRETIIESFKKTGRAVIVHEAPRTGGLGGELTALIQEEALLYQKAPVTRITGHDVAYPLFEFEDHYIPSQSRIEDGIQDVVSF